MHFVVEKIKEFICRVDPHHVGAFITNAFELLTLAILFYMVLRLYFKTKKLHKDMRRYHPDDK